METSVINRNESYFIFLEENMQNLRYRQILEVLIGFNQLTTKDICMLTGLPVNCVSGRLTELKKRGIITETGTEKDLKTNRNVTLWSIC